MVSGKPATAGLADAKKCPVCVLGRIIRMCLTPVEAWLGGQKRIALKDCTLIKTSHREECTGKVKGAGQTREVNQSRPAALVHQFDKDLSLGKI